MSWLRSPDKLIIFENENYLAVNKPFGVATLEDRNNPGNSIIEQFRKLISSIQVAHRLDKETTGVLLMAKNPEAYRHISIQFEHRKVRKEYHAVVHGIHNYQLKEVDFPLLTQNNGTVRIDASGKESLTYFTTIEAFKSATLVKCVPITGRTHQIRVHLSALGSPIVQDPKYGGNPIFLSEVKRNYRLRKDEEERPMISRVALHAYSLEFRNALDEVVSIHAPYPKDFEVLIKQLGVNRR